MNIWYISSEQIFENSFREKARPSICFKTPARVFQTLVHWGLESLRENQKLDWEFEKFGQVFKKLVSG